MILKTVWIAVLLGIIPVILGLPWIKVLKPKHQLSFAYCSGFFIALSLYETVCLPVILSHGSFFTIVIVYLIVLIFSCGYCVLHVCKGKYLTKRRIEKLHWTEWLYLFGLFIIIGIQIIRVITYDITYMSYDDARYTVIAADANARNGIMNIDSYTGIGTTLILKNALASWNVYPAFFSTMSGISVVTMEHTVQSIQLIVLMYSVCWFIAGEVFDKRDNQLISLIIVALFYWFGYHSHYSLTFRLLGPNYQGKAVLAVSLTPLILTVLIKTLDEPYSHQVGFYIFLMSFAALALTLWGTGTVLVILLVPLILSLFRNERKWKQLLYIPWGSFAPLLGIVFFLLYKLAV